MPSGTDPVFALDRTGGLSLSRRMPDDRDAIAIVGGGPAGLAAAEVLEALAARSRSTSACPRSPASC